MEWESVIGLEIHVQLATDSKIFSGAATAYGAEPNTQACAIDLGLPGVLPVLNQEVIRMAIKLGLAIDAKIENSSVFARKNYFYPDLPKGYQISQYDKPIVYDGHLDIVLEEGAVTKRIGVTRAHLEEDAGKSLHDAVPTMTGIDLNRAGTPLLEIVSEPDLRSAAEAVAYLKTMHGLVRYLEISDANMQEGSFRCDANVSMRPSGQVELGTRAEIKNLNSFRFIEKAINYEIERQINVLESGDKVVQETRLYDADKDETRSMRSKEEAMDYRYFPDPDLLPIEIDEQIIHDIQSTLPELPWVKRERFAEQFQLSLADAAALTQARELAEYFETAVNATSASPKKVANWISVELTGALNKDSIDITQSPISATDLAGLLDKIEDNTISGKMAKTVFEAMYQGEGDAASIIKAKGMKQITDTSAIEKIIDEVLANNPSQLEQYRSGKEKLFGFFVGQVMQATKGQANPQQVNELLQHKLNS